MGGICPNSRQLHKQLLFAANHESDPKAPRNIDVSEVVGLSVNLLRSLLQFMDELGLPHLYAVYFNALNLLSMPPATFGLHIRLLQKRSTTWAARDIAVCRSLSNLIKALELRSTSQGVNAC